MRQSVVSNSAPLQNNVSTHPWWLRPLSVTELLALLESLGLESAPVSLGGCRGGHGGGGWVTVRAVLDLNCCCVSWRCFGKAARSQYKSVYSRDQGSAADDACQYFLRMQGNRAVSGVVVLEGEGVLMMSCCHILLFLYYFLNSVGNSWLVVGGWRARSHSNSATHGLHISLQHCNFSDLLPQIVSLLKCSHFSSFYRQHLFFFPHL